VILSIYLNAKEVIKLPPCVECLVGLAAGLLKKLWMNFHEIFGRLLAIGLEMVNNGLDFGDDMEPAVWENIKLVIINN